MLGVHVSVAGGLVNGLIEAEGLRLECAQVFTSNQRQWKSRPLDEGAVETWHEKLASMGWGGRRVARVVSHNSYLINMASPDPALWRRSVNGQRTELERCETLSIPLCVAHPGAHLGETTPRGTPHDLGEEPSRDERAGLARIVRALDRIHEDLPGYRTLTCLETTAGAGTNLGYDFGHLAWIRERVREPERVAFCLDTCHVTAAGYDLSTDASALEVMRLWGRVCGFGPLKVLHLNDSKGVRGSRLDRHVHIGDGCCGLSCFRTILNHPRLRNVPMILETPRGSTSKGTPWDLVNLRRLKRLADPPDPSR